MLAHWSIRNKLLLAVALLAALVSALAFSGFQGAYAYRGLARSISRRAAELPHSTALARDVAQLRLIAGRVSEADAAPYPVPEQLDRQTVRAEFRTQLMVVAQSLHGYSDQLGSSEIDDPRIDDTTLEWQTVESMRAALARVSELNLDDEWVFSGNKSTLLAHELDELGRLADELPSFLQHRMHDVAGEVRGQYRAWIVLTWITSLLAGVLLVLLVALIYHAVFRPLHQLVSGSRRVAAGDYTYQIQLNTHDEMASLAAAMNESTARFREVRDDLDRQVQERTRELVRNERLAGVGFLAAGVAHEINNPLAAIAMCAESLETRLKDIIASDDAKSDDEHNPEISILRNYLRTIQDEAFRCKGITERLLDFARGGDKQKHPTELSELVGGVIDMVRHIGRYKHKQVEFSSPEPVVALVNAQEIKQVVLNLVVNGLDSLDAGGKVEVLLRRARDTAELIVRDNGCGMTDEVLEHLFEPFFTSKRDTQGTGLGLSIAWRIVADHHGRIEPSSEGPGRGSQFRLTIPLQQHEENGQKFAAAA